jgi:hypothetical protein
MKYLKRFKIFETYNSIEEYTYYVVDNLKKFNIIQSQMNYLLDFYMDKVEFGYENGQNPFEIANKIAKELELDSGGKMQYNKIGNKYQQINYL